jgi:hypothetical protein
MIGGKDQAHEFSPMSGRPLPLTAAERARLMAIIERSDRILAKDPEAIAEAEALAKVERKAQRAREREQKRAHQARLLAHLDETVEELVERCGHWRCRDVGMVADGIRVELGSLAGLERWSPDSITRALTRAIK